LTLLELVVWREAQNQGHEGMRAVAWSIKNRVAKPCWWGKDWQSVILKPWQYSSFNLSDPNYRKWPTDTDVAFATVCEVCAKIYVGSDAQDPTDGATHYYAKNIPLPPGWGNESQWINTLNIGLHKFYKQRPPEGSGDIHMEEA